MSDTSSPARGTVLRAFGEEDLRLYLGQEAQPFVTFWERQKASGYPFVWSWTWWGALFPIPWLFYRKLWAIGAVLVLLPILLDALIEFGLNTSLALGLLVGLTGKALVVDRAESKTQDINDLGLVSQDSIERVRRAGGVSVPGAVIGAILMLSSMGLVLYENFPNRLPSCKAPAVRDVVVGISAENLDAIGLPAGELLLQAPRQVGVKSGSGRACHAELESVGVLVGIEYDVLWHDRDRGRYVVDVRLRDGDKQADQD